MQSLKFLSPENLYFLLPLGLVVIAGFLIHFFLRKRFDLFLLRYRAEEFSRLRSTAGWLAMFSFLALALVCLVLALAQPILIQPAKHANFLITYDLSKSMAVEDYRLTGKACSRMDVVNLALANLVAELPPESRLGVSTFVGNSYWPKHMNLIRTYPQEIGPSRKELITLISWIHWSQAWEGGTPVQLALVGLVEKIKANPGDFGDNLTIVIITDGEENNQSNYYIPPDTGDPPKPMPQTGSGIYVSTDLVKGLKINFVVVGAGTPTGGPIPVFDGDWNFVGYQKDYSSGNDLISKRDDAFLTEMAQKLGADYLQLNDPDDLKILAHDPKYQIAESRLQKSLSSYLILTALFLFLAVLVL